MGLLITRALVKGWLENITMAPSGLIILLIVYYVLVLIAQAGSLERNDRARLHKFPRDFWIHPHSRVRRLRKIGRSEQASDSQPVTHSILPNYQLHNPLRRNLVSSAVIIPLLTIRTVHLRAGPTWQI